MVPTLMSTEVSAVCRDGGRLKVLAVVLAAVGVPDEADHPRMLRVRIGGGYSRISSSSDRVVSAVLVAPWVAGSKEKFWEWGGAS
jgi:hypothetical protein